MKVGDEAADRELAMTGPRVGVFVRLLGDYTGILHNAGFQAAARMWSEVMRNTEDRTCAVRGYPSQDIFVRRLNRLAPSISFRPRSVCAGSMQVPRSGCPEPAPKVFPEQVFQ